MGFADLQTDGEHAGWEATRMVKSHINRLTKWNVFLTINPSAHPRFLILPGVIIEYRMGGEETEIFKINTTCLSHSVTGRSEETQ